MAQSTKLKVLAAAGGFALVAFLILNSSMCLRAYFKYGVVVPKCPYGELRQVAQCTASALRRGSKGTVTISASAYYTTGPSDAQQSLSLPHLTGELFLVDAKGAETKLPVVDAWMTPTPTTLAGNVVLPPVHDGEYTLRAKVKTVLGESTVDVPLPIYAPARVHVLTDRPLYEPGNTVRFRALVLRAKDLVPLDQRPGHWLVTDPSGEVLLEEKAPAGEWGVVAGSFPIDESATSGVWRVAWVSGDARDEVTFKVEPFTLPRFRVEASAAKPFYRAHEKPAVKGSVTYSSGAPVAKARLTIEWTPSGAWPPPTAWLEKLLPKTATTDAAGRFTLELPEIPADLRGQNTLAAAIEAVDGAGDRVTGSASVLLTEDAIDVSAVTELGDGLAEGFNNRVYLRATTASGEVLANTPIVVKRAWDASDKGTATKTDEDGVASLQFDPGPAVNVVIPAMPVRLPPKPPAVTRTSTNELISGDEPSLADQKAFDGWLAALEPCARFVERGNQDTANLGIHVDASGAVIAVGNSESPVNACVAKAVKSLHLAAGKERLFNASWTITGSDLASLSPAVEAIPSEPEGLSQALLSAAMDSRPCLPSTAEGGMLPRLVRWHSTKGSKEVALSFGSDPNGAKYASEVTSCVEKHFSKVELSEPAPETAVGIAHLTVEPSERMEEERPQPTVMLGYELAVSAGEGGKLGNTKVRLQPGQIPQIRLRATPVIVEPGGQLSVEILRGPEYQGELPEKLSLYNEGRALEEKVDKENRRVVFKLPPDAQGFLELNWAGARALAFVKPKASLSVEIEPKQKRYAPGQTAQLDVRTAVAGKGSRAAVGLFGVDESMAQLATLLGPDELARVRPTVTSNGKAFNAIDVQALALGRVRGANAAAATILKVATVPSPAEIDSYVSGSGSESFDPIAELTDRFYTALAELSTQTRQWEESAPKDEKMHPVTMAKLWSKALSACEARNENVKDSFGRRLRLSQLPPDLLALTDPRVVVVDGTRLPEDVENWSAWVAKEMP